MDGSDGWAARVAEAWNENKRVAVDNRRCLTVGHVYALANCEIGQRELGALLMAVQEGYDRIPRDVRPNVKTVGENPKEVGRKARNSKAIRFRSFASVPLETPDLLK